MDASRAEVPPRSPGSKRLLEAGIPLGRWAGVPVSAHWSAAVAVALFAWLLAGQVLPPAAPGYAPAARWAVGVGTAIVFLATLLAHEFAHALAARHFGMGIRKITLWMLGGLTELDGEPRSPRADAWIAAVGPLVSMGIGGLCAGVEWLTGAGGLWGGAVIWLAEVSVLIGLFNLLPGAPLDGGRMLRALLWWRYRDPTRANAAAARAGRGLGIVLVVLGVLEVLVVGIAGAWLVLLGWFIVNSAAAERHSAGAQRLEGRSAGDVMHPSELTVPDWWTVRRLLEELWSRRPASQVFATVDFAGEASGVVRVADVQRARPDARDSLRVREIVRRGASVTLPRDAPAGACLPIVARGGVVVVTEDRRPVGLVTAADWASAQMMAELGVSSARQRDARNRSVV